MTKTIGTVVATIATGAALYAGGSAARMNYECWSYLNGKPDKMINVLADDRQDAERQAVPRLRDVGAKEPGSARCK